MQNESLRKRNIHWLILSLKCLCFSKGRVSPVNSTLCLKSVVCVCVCSFLCYCFWGVLFSFNPHKPPRIRSAQSSEGLSHQKTVSLLQSFSHFLFLYFQVLIFLYHSLEQKYTSQDQYFS